MEEAYAWLLKELGSFPEDEASLAVTLQVHPDEIRRHLSETFSLEDVDALVQALEGAT